MFNIKMVGKAALFLGALSLTWSCSSGDKGKDQKKEGNKKQVADASLDKAQAQEAGAGASSRPAEKQIKKAFCVLNPKSDSEVVGAITFTEVEGGVRIIADVGGLNPGKHGFHIHEKGDCSAADASSAGAHYNPTNKKHGGPDSQERHVGDLGNLDANQNGLAHYDRVDTVISLNGPYSIIGKSVVVHADPDDLKTDPSGNSGKRIACGEIVESEM